MNKKKIGIGLWIGLTLLLAHKLNADTIIETRVTAITPLETKTWIKGKMQRIETKTLLFETSSQSQVSVVRADKGITWTLNPENKTYTETPMALPYNPNMAQTFQAFNQPGCVTETENMKQTKPLLGVQVEGIMEWCKESPYQKRIYWLAPKTNNFVAAKKNVKEFSEAQMAAQYMNYPAADQEKFRKDSVTMASVFGLFSAGSTNFNYADRLVLANETDLNGRLTSVFEITSISVKNLDDTLFEIPKGYTKTDINQTLQDMMKQIQQMKQPQPVTK